jgi:hypothetical protein
MEELKFLENCIQKIANLMVIGYGDAGTELIASILRDSNNLQLHILRPGKKMVGIFGFCSIRNFAQTSKNLEKSIMSYIN